MNRRAIAILGAIFILIVGSLGVIIFLRNRSNNQQVVTPTEPEVVNQPTIEEPQPEPEPSSDLGRATKLTDEAVVTPALFFQGNGITYFNAEGRLFQTDLSVSGNTVLLSNKRELTIAPKAGIAKILWPRVGGGLIAETGSGSSRVWSSYDSNKGAYIQLPAQIKSVDWLPSGDKIIFTWVENGQTNINIANPDTTGYQVLTDLYEPDNELKVSPDGQTILFYRTQVSDLSKNNINSVSIDGKTFKSVIKDGYNTGALWSNDSKKFLFNRRDAFNQKLNLWLADISTGEVKNLGVVAPVEKAIWTKNNNAILVAVPGSGAMQDSVSYIDIATGNRSELNPGISVDIQEMFLNLDETVLFFKNQADGFLYYMFVK